MKKKVLSMVLAGIMCVSILAGCGTEPTQEETAQNVTTQENSAMRVKVRGKMHGILICRQS